MSIVEEKILSKEFTYEQPWFYNNKLSLRCELGVGNDTEYMCNAKNRALQIFRILFSKGADCLFFNHYIYDYDTDDKITNTEINNIIKQEKNTLRFSLNYQRCFINHKTINNININYDNELDFLVRVNRIVCYLNNDTETDTIINAQIENQMNPLISFASFENECILSIYDDRGCDVIFFNENTFVKYYSLLEPYFLDYDKEEMKRKFDSTNR